MLTSFRRSCAAAPALALACTVLASPHAQAADDAPAPEGPRVEIDLEALLTDARVTATSLEDPVLLVVLDEGAALFQVPVRIRPGAEAAVLEQPATGLAGAQLLGWSVPAEEDAATGGGRQAAALVDPRVGAPRLAEALTVRPDGSLSWEVQRLGRGFEVSASGGGSAGASLYAYLLDTDLLRDARPEAPDRNARATDRATLRAEQDAYRAARDAYDQLRDAVDALPTRIEAPGGTPVWLVYEVRRPESARVFEADGQRVWTVDPEAFDALRAMAGTSGGGGGGASGGDAGRLLRPDRLVTASEPLGAEAAALAAGRSIAAGTPTGGDAAADPALPIAEAVATRGPEAAVRRLIRELAQAVPPTPTTVRLIAAAAPRAGTYGQVAALQARLLGLEPSTTGVPDLATARAIGELQSLLEAPDGPEVAALVEAVADAAADRPVLADAAAGLRPERLPAERRDALIAAVLRRAAADAEASEAQPARGSDQASPLAAFLLDRVLLRSFDPQVVRATLGSLEAAAGGDSRLSPALDLLRRAITGPASPEALPDGEAPGDAGPARPVELAAGSLVLDGPEHGLIQQLRSGDPEVRETAAGTLRLFRLPEGGGGGTESSDTLTALLSATGDAAPAGLVTLLSRSPDQPAVNEALLRLLARAEGSAASRVRLRLFGSERSLAPALETLEPEQRVAAAAAVLSGGSPEAAGLVLDRQGAGFLAEELAAGRSFDAAALARAVGDDDTLLRLAGDADPALARGAMAGLAAAAGADAAAQTAAVAAMTEGGQSPADAWPAIRDRLRLAQLARAAGTYRLVVTTGPAAPAAGGSPGNVSVLPGLPGNPAPGNLLDGSGAPDAGAVNAATEVRRVELGIVVLSVTDEGLRMAGDPLKLELAPDQPAIRLADPLQLANFPGEEILAVPLAAASGPLDLLETPAGWRGSTPLGAGGTLGVEMIRTGE